MCPLGLPPTLPNKLITWTLLVLSVLLSGKNVVPVGACRFQPDSSVQCEVIENSMCRSTVPRLHFNSTSFPNIYGHRSQDEVSEFLQNSRLLELNQLNCSTYINIFICSAVYPLCYPKLFQRVEPCRELCEAVRDGCADRLFHSFSMQWPSPLECDRFPPYGTEICIWNETSSCSRSIETGDLSSTVGTGSDSVPTAPVRSCTGHLSPVNRSQATFGGFDNCVESCRGVYFEQEQDTLLTIWTTAVSFLILVVSILTFFTYLLNYKIIRSLEVPIYYTVLCYGCLALAHLISVAIGKDALICDHTLLNSFNQSMLITEGLTSPVCSTMFSVTYYFTLCTWSWWLVLTIQWSLCSLRCTNIGNPWKAVFHLIAWGLPVPFMLGALFSGKFSGSPVMQSCWIHKQSQVEFLIVPLATVIGIFCVLLVVSFARVVNLQKKKFEGLQVSTHTDNDPHFVDPSQLVRVGNYLTVTLIPMSILFGVYFYDYWYRYAWEATYLTCPPSASSLHSCDAVPSTAKPSVYIYLAGIFLSMCMGFFSVFWLFRTKLFLAWRSVCCLVCVYGVRRYDFVRTNSSGDTSRAPSQLETIGIRTQSSRESRV